ncbi:glycosyltransferase family 2 protein [Veillonella criceti]|uniref:Hyaluronan synthase n=1 Tax=Veillonella criceti TaxID=103891 RepID=A0A380NFP0_9FIRM|nr:glycosyltransferase family 2 protein [Veillonella criceti]SUP39463.1 Hyaluronan synthase [Veillonella criceti]
MKKISVIVPVYKVEKYIHECVDSILNQTYKNLEVILVDDGSPDNCGKICDEYAIKDKRVKVIHKKNGGLSDARNAGIEEAKGEVISFIDSDDYIDASMFSNMIEYLEDNDLDMVCADTFIVRGNRKRYKLHYNKNIIYDGIIALNKILSGRIDNSACNKIYKREIIADIRFPIGRKYEDVATIYKYVFNAKRVGYLSQAVYYYRKISTSITGSSFNSQSRYDCFIGYRERLEFAKLHQLDCIHDCELLALETALSTLTVFYALGEHESSERYREVISFIESHLNIKLVDRLRKKHKLLLWSFKNFKPLHKIYAKLSSLSKRI